MERAVDSDEPEGDDDAGRAGGLPAAPSELGDALRTAVERTLSATADSATETRQRAQSLLDEVVRRGQVAREGVARRGEEASNRLGDAINDLRTPDGDELRSLGERVAGIERRMAALEARISAVSNLEVDAEGTPSKPLEQGDLE